MQFRVLKQPWTVVAALLSLALAVAPTRANAASFDSSRLIDDGTFVNTGAMSVGDVQSFLNLRGGFLKDFSENGRSAAQIIVDAAHGYGDASGTWGDIVINGSTGTVNPQVLLVTLQKEQSLLTMTDRSDGALRAAMGYGCPDSDLPADVDSNNNGCYDAYEGFTKQVENAAWQFRYNYERAQGHGFGDYQVGQSFCFNDARGTNCGTFGNRATASLYRYTPYVYNGNYNFTQFFASWFTAPAFAVAYVSQSANPTLDPGEAAQLQLNLKNVGTETWSTTGSFPVRLGTSHDLDRISGFLREGGSPTGWISANRIGMSPSSVAPGETATFTFWITAPSDMGAGTYQEHFRPVADGFSWLNDFGIYWDVTVTIQHHASVSSQSRYPTIAQGQSAQLTIGYLNTGSTTWTPSTVRLGTSHERDRVSPFLRSGGSPSGWLSENRMVLQESSVPPGEVGHFAFWITAPSDMTPGTYREYVQPVADGVGWMEDYGVYWDVRVESAASQYRSAYAAQSGYPTISRGSPTQLSVAYTNTGTATWDASTFHLGTSHAQDRVSAFLRSGGDPSGWSSSNRVQLQESSVAPGETGHFVFWITAPSGMTPGTYREYFQPVADGITWLEDYGVYWDVTVQ